MCVAEGSTAVKGIVPKTDTSSRLLTSSFIKTAKGASVSVFVFGDATTHIDIHDEHLSLSLHLTAAEARELATEIIGCTNAAGVVQIEPDLSAATV